MTAFLLAVIGLATGAIAAVVGVFVSSGALACGWGSKTAQTAGENQTVMTDHGTTGSIRELHGEDLIALDARVVEDIDARRLQALVTRAPAQGRRQAAVGLTRRQGTAVVQALGGQTVTDC